MVKTEELNEGDVLTKVALETSAHRLPYLMQMGESEDISIFQVEGVSYAYCLAWTIEGNEMDFFLEVSRVTPGKRKNSKPNVEVAVSRQFTERIEA